MSEARHHRLVVTEVAREIDDDHPWIGTVQRKGQLEAVVGRSVVDDHHLDVVRDALRGLDGPAVEFVNSRGRPIERCHDGEFHGCFSTVV